MSGVKGMRWGVRRSSAALRSAAAARGDAKPKTDVKASAAPKSAAAAKPAGNIQDHVESSGDRYARLAAQAKGGGASAMTDQDLKFFNARTEALSKINKITEEKPSWLKETTTKVIQQSAQRQMQGLADAVADKYIGDPLKNALKGATETAATTAKAAAPAAGPAASVKGAVAKVTGGSEKSRVPGMTPEQSVQYFRDNPVRNQPLPKDYSPSGNHDLFKTLRDQGLTDSPSSKVAGVSKNVADLPDSVKKVTVPAKTNPANMQFSEALKYYADNPSVPATPPQGYSSNASKLFLDEIARLRGQ